MKGIWLMIFSANVIIKRPRKRLDIQPMRTIKLRTTRMEKKLNMTVITVLSMFLMSSHPKIILLAGSPIKLSNAQTHHAVTANGRVKTRPVINDFLIDMNVTISSQVM